MNHTGVKTFTTPTIPCRFKFCRNTSCNFWHPPVCLNYKFEKVVYMATNAISDMLRQKSNKVGAKKSVAIVKEFKQLGFGSQDSYPRKSIPRQPGKLGTKRAIKFSRGTLHQIKIRERKGPSQGIIQKCAPHECCLCAPKFEERCAHKVGWI